MQPAVVMPYRNTTTVLRSYVRTLIWWVKVALMTGLVGTAWARDPAGDVRVTSAAELTEAHPRPRLKLSIDRFSVGNLDTSPVPLTGAHLDVYPLSEPWMRGGFTLEGGTGHASAVNSSISLTYGLLGLGFGVQYPGRVTPFVEGHLSGGVLSGHQDGPIAVAGATVVGASGTTWLYSRGIDLGAEFYVSGRWYVSAALGWTRATWGAPDFSARVQNPQADWRLLNITADSLVWKLGVGI